MEAFVFTGLQRSAKSSFQKELFFTSRSLISFDLLRTRNREDPQFEDCLETEQRFAIDNTNQIREERANHLACSAEFGIRVVG